MNKKRRNNHFDIDDLFEFDNNFIFDHNILRKIYKSDYTKTSLSLDNLSRFSDSVKRAYEMEHNIKDCIDQLAIIHNDTLLDIKNNTVNDEKEAQKKELYESLIDTPRFKSVDELITFVGSYIHFVNVLEDLSNYLRKYTFEEALALVNEIDKYFDNYDKEDDNDYNLIFQNITYFMIANYYTDNKLSKDNFFYPTDYDTTQQEQVVHINALIAGLTNKDTTELRNMLNNYIQKSNIELKETITKKSQRILQNAYKKADKCNDNEKQLYDIKDSATSKLNKLITPYTNIESKHVVVTEIVDEVLKDLNVYIDEYIIQIKKHDEEERIAKEKAIIETKENNDTQTNDKNIIIKDNTPIKQNPIEKKENTNDSPTTKENKTSIEKKPVLQEKTSYESLHNTINNYDHYDSSNIIRIGKFELIKDSKVDNPIDYEAIAKKLHKDDADKLGDVEAIIDQYGLDKINTYLSRTKLNTLHIEQLERYLQLDRSLRYEYQKLMEDIEMYFSSTFSSYITNKYDKKYNLVSTNNTYEYRGYLSKTLFIDPIEHYDAIKQLRERIDIELSLNNEQIINEFTKHKYSISFAAALGIMTFGWSVNMFNNLNSQDKAEYLSIYYKNLTSYTFNNWINNLLGFRNRLAHYKELYKISSYDMLKPITTTYSDGNSYDDEFEHSTLFYYTIVIARLSPDVENIEDFIDNVGILFRKAERKNECFNLQNDYSFPKTWKLILENEKSTKVNALQ